MQQYQAIPAAIRIAFFGAMGLFLAHRLGLPGYLLGFGQGAGTAIAAAIHGFEDAVLGWLGGTYVFAPVLH